MVAQLDLLYIKTRPTKALVRILSHLLFQGRFLTTKHRWLNSYILAELKAIKQIPQLKSVEKPIFIIGTGRSGSTILGKVFSMHRLIGFLNEPKALWYAVDARDDVNGHFNCGPALYRFGDSEVNPLTKQSAHRLFGFYLALTGAGRVLDKNPEIVFRIPFVRAIFPDAKFIFLVRNGWDTIHSIATWSKHEAKSAQGALYDWWGINQRKWQLMLEQLVPTEPLLADVQAEIRLFTQQEHMAAVEWIITMQEGLRSLKVLPDYVYQVRYEELTKHPQSVLEEVAEFCELPKDKTFLSYAQKVLSPVPTKQRLPLPSTIKDAFLDTMSALDYSSGNAL
jgi:hypothetical protein